ncbi:MAG: sensor domain-containing diguanylate cyclase [Actinomycetes bacterium]
MDSDLARSRLRSVARLSRVLSEPREMSELLETAANEVRFALGASSVAIGHLERDRGVIAMLINVGALADWEQAQPTELTSTLQELPMVDLLAHDAAGHVLNINDPQADPEAIRHLTVRGKACALVIPILLDGRIWGQVFATRAVGEAVFEDADIELGEALSAVLASGLAQAERFSRVEHLVYSDPLTGLANRRAIDLALERALVEYQVTDIPVSVVMADVNGLKFANDNEGHQAGDRLIRACADAISQSAGRVPRSLAGRIGGDEFAIILPGLALEEAEPFANSILNALEKSMYPGGLAIGVSSTSAPGVSGEVTSRRLLGWADEAQYAAKREGSSRVLLAGRDTPLTEPIERRRRRRSGPVWATNAERANNALEAGLRVLVMSAQLSPIDRLVAVIDAAADVIGAVGWVVSIIDGGTTRAVAFSTVRDGLDVTSGQDLTNDPTWWEAASGVGVLVRADDETADLARVRGCSTVAAAVSGSWLVEVLGDTDDHLVGVSATLRALLGSALAG